ncbi:MAG: hypothetical protein H0Z29_05570 [Candidatus Marinimicrobia bacterium]|nr:hypothetical protein [Candidatus Neomarinimicrobiota bacterium]
MAELIRIFYKIDSDETQLAINNIIETIIPVVWEVDGKLRILHPELKMKDSTLLLLYHSRNGLSEKKLVENLEHSNLSVYRRDILTKLHKKRFIEFNEKTKIAKISPKGRNYVENNLLKNLT